MKKEKKKITTYQLTTTALMAAMLCILGPISIPIGPVPMSLATFLLHMMVFILGTKLSAVSVILYLLLGLVGLPVFAGGAGGIGTLAGPTGGFLVGYILLVLVQGIWQKSLAKQDKIFIGVLGMLMGLGCAYFFGTVWFAYQQKTTLFAAFSICVLPFLLGDAIKIVAAVLLGPKIKKRLELAGL